MKAAVTAIKFFESFANKGIRGQITAKFFSGLLKLIHPRAKRIDENLKIAYPESDSKWRKEIRRKVYENLAWTLTETLILQHDNKQVFNWVKKVHGLEIINNLLDENKPAILLTAHFSNWELLGNFVALNAINHNNKLHVLYTPMHDKDIDNYVLETLERGGMFMINKDFSVMKLIRMLKGGAHIASLNDVSGTGKMIVPFLGRNATNMPGVAVMSILSGAPIIPICSYRLAPFEHEIEIFEPVKMPDSSLNHDERLRLTVLECNKALEKFIRKRPDLWFWLHNRWRD
ncbi:MAG: lysophospholipid acyltransferase family protein [Synergistaceae bacterium]|nr:lysophospholipid acyltransferase family protein [Synergistaceae bacterium]